MAIPTSNITENYAAFKILTYNQLHTAMEYIDTQFNSYTSPNFTQLALDVFGTYTFNNDGVQTVVPCLADIVAKLADNETITGSWTFSNPITFNNTVTSTSTLSSSGQMRAKVYLPGPNQAIPDATVTALNFTAESYDVGGLHDNGVLPNRLTLPGNGSGTYLIHGQATFAANATGRRELYIYKNSVLAATVKEFGPDAGQQTVLQVSMQDTASAGDYYELRVYQNSGGNLDAVNGAAVSFFSAMKVW